MMKHILAPILLLVFLFPTLALSDEVTMDDLVPLEGLGKNQIEKELNADFRRGVAAHRTGDYESAIRIWRPLANKGNAAAQYSLGVMYYKGRGALQDSEKAAKWFRFSAEQGDADSQHNLGMMYQQGDGVPKESATAVKWFRLAAEQGHAASQGNLGVMYAFGDGVLQDYVYAHMWGNIAALNGNELGAKLRGEFGKKMTPTQIAEAQDLARECVRKEYKGC